MTVCLLLLLFFFWGGHYIYTYIKDVHIYGMIWPTIYQPPPALTSETQWMAGDQPMDATRTHYRGNELGAELDMPTDMEGHHGELVGLKI